MASAASQMEAMRLPLRELRKRFTKSELFVMAWRSSEISYNMDAKMPKLNTVPSAEFVAGLSEAVATDQERRIESQIGGFADKITDDTGDLTLKKLTGKQVMTYMAAMGIQGRS